jgi:hypothetical protein
MNFIVVIKAVCSSQPQELKLELGVKLPVAEHGQRHPRAASEQMARSVTQVWL